MRITLLRHAQTEGNLRSNYVGVTDEALSAVGVETARRARAARGESAVKTVHTSALRRAVETAAILYPDAAVVRHAGLNEMHFGAFENRNFADLENDPAYAAWVESHCELPCPGGESKEEFTRRCRAAFLEICTAGRAAGEETLHFVVHGGTIMAIMSAFAQPTQNYFAWHTDFCNGYLLEGTAWTSLSR